MVSWPLPNIHIYTFLHTHTHTHCHTHTFTHLQTDRWTDCMSWETFLSCPPDRVQRNAQKHLHICCTSQQNEDIIYVWIILFVGQIFTVRRGLFVVLSALTHLLELKEQMASKDCENKAGQSLWCYKSSLSRLLIKHLIQEGSEQHTSSHAVWTRL